MKPVELKKGSSTIWEEALLWFSAVVFLFVCFAALVTWVGFLTIGLIRLIGD